jgi:Transposase domain (DUF772)
LRSLARNLPRTTEFETEPPPPTLPPVTTTKNTPPPIGCEKSGLAPFYSTTGRPSIDPELLVRMLIIGYCYGIRSERRLCEEVHLNLAYRWFCRLGLAGEVPDHSTFSKNRHGASARAISCAMSSRRWYAAA